MGLRQETHTIAALAEEFGLTARAIRHYEALGLLAPARLGLARRFTGQDRARLKFIVRNIRLGASLAEIGELFELYDSAQHNAERLKELLVRIEHRRAQLEQRRADIDAMLDEIAFFERLCRKKLE